MKLLFVANKLLPDNDYRVAYAKMSRHARVTLALPGRPTSVDSDRYIRLGFGEGLCPADFWHFVQLYRYLRRSNDPPDIVHFFSTKLMLFGPITARLAGHDSVITITGLGRSFSGSALRFRMLQRLYRVIMRRSVSQCRAVFFQNAGHQALFERWFPTEAQKFRMIGSAVAEDEPPSNKSFSEPCLNVIHVARLMPSKGVLDFLNVARQLESPKFRFRLAGPPSQGSDKLFAEVQQAAASGTIEYLGELGPHDLQRAYNEAHVLYFPSYGEGLSRVMLEAGVSGICPVAYDIDGNRDLVTAGRGFLVPIGSCTEAQEIIGMLAADRAVLEANARSYQRHIRATFGVAGFVRRMDSLMLTLTSDTGPAL